MGKKFHSWQPYHGCKPATCRLFICCTGTMGQKNLSFGITVYYIPINDTSFELSVFWPSDTESRINELRFSESISLSFKTRLKSVTCFCGDIT